MESVSISEFRTRRFVLVAIFVGGLFLIVLNDFLRRHAQLDGGLALIAIGLLPNFAAGLTLPAAALAVLSQNCRSGQLSGLALGRISGLVSMALLTAWEFAQTARPGMVFDSGDILATILGGTIWLAIWPRLDRVLPAT